MIQYDIDRGFTFVHVGAALKHKGEPEDDLGGEGGVHAADPTPTQDFVYHVQDVDPL